MGSVQKPALWEWDSELFGAPSQPTREPWNDHSPEFDAHYRRKQAQRRASFTRHGRAFAETVANPEEISRAARRARGKRERYFSGETETKRRGDPRLALPAGDDLRALADTFGASPERLTQGEAMAGRGLGRKAKRLVLCGRIGHRVNCSENPAHRFLQPYLCRCRYCETCGPQWFREKFSDLLAALEPVVEHLADESHKRECNFVIAKLDFTVPNVGRMPSPAMVREFHRDMRVFWRIVERVLGIGRKEYGHAGCDEFGGSNTNLHRHSLYAGPVLPQRRKELSALWSIAGLRGARWREMLRFIRKHGLRNAWYALAPNERRFVSIKRARSFRAALAHAMKYPAKFLSLSTPERLAELEAVFHKTRRFSTGGAFYRVKPMREPGEDSTFGSCPLCGARLCEVVSGWVPCFELEAEGRRNVEIVRREIARSKIFGMSGSP